MVLHETGRQAGLVVAGAFRPAVTALSESAHAHAIGHRTREGAGQHEARRVSRP